MGIYTIFSVPYTVYIIWIVYLKKKKQHSASELYFRPLLTSFIAGNAVKEFFSHFNSAFPGTKSTVKMHILKMHIDHEWMSTCNAGFGLMREQGTESIHAHFRKLYRTYGCMANKVQRLKCIMQEHHLCVYPTLNVLKPDIETKKRKRKLKTSPKLLRHSWH